MAKQSEEIIYVEISEIDYLLISHIRDLRLKKGLTQLQLTQKMKLADGFISKVETYTERAKYNIRHLPLLAKALEVKLIDVLPKEMPKYDIVRLTLKRNNRINKNGSISTKKETIVIKVVPVNL